MTMYKFSHEKEVLKGVDWILDSGEEFSNRDIYRKVMTHLADAEKKDMEKEQEIRKRKTAEHFKELVSNSTLHGLHFCFDKRHFIRRICWTLLILLALGLLVQKLYESTRHFFSYPFSTTTTIKYKDNMPFPAVSICNLNDVRYSVIKGTKLHNAIITKGDVFSLDGKEYTDTIRRANHRLKDMLSTCRIKNMPCTVKNFTEFNHNQGDRCFTFNSGQHGHNLITVNNTGLKQALEMTINIEHHDYFTDTVGSGMHLILHGQEETPVKMQGVILSPGFKTYIEVKKRKVKNLPHPYKTNCGKLDLKYFSGYSMHLCWLEKLTDHVVKECGCKDWFMPGDHKVCSLNESSTCMWIKWENFDKYKKYSCPLPCVIDTYYPMLSASVFPANIEADRLAAHHKLNGTTLEKRTWIRDNYLSVVVYYGELSYEFMEQVPSYDLMVLLGDIGGQLGLFLGSSVLTYIEFFDCFAMVIYTRFFEVFKKKPAYV
eukprot:Seg1212.4 transcript_id=Seg1212.4/GoldUCD/mRNA.D3Y31 product="Acid-sensing ion channel 3" protein_id=Seg1212.4/GoldUCD/D3Y31